MLSFSDDAVVVRQVLPASVTDPKRSSRVFIGLSYRP
jgi:hypothetical protein